MNQFAIITRHVYKKNVKSGSWLFLVISPIIFIVTALTIGWYVNNQSAQEPVGILSRSTMISTSIEKSLPKSDAIKVSSNKEAVTLLREGKIGGYLSVSGDSLSTATLTLRNNKSKISLDKLSTAINTIKIALEGQMYGLSSSQVNTLLTPVHIKTKYLQKQSQTSESSAVRQIFATICSMFILIVTMVYGSIIAQEIALEKGTKIIEILLSATQARTIFFSKITGILLLLLTQITIYLGLFLLAWPIVKKYNVIRSIIKRYDWSFIYSREAFLILLFFIAGVLTFCVLAALTGSLISGQEQVNMAVAPITLLAVVGYYISFIAQSTDSTLVIISSYLPFLNFEVMPTRLAIGNATFLDAIGSLTINILFLAGFTWLVTKLFEKNILDYTHTPKKTLGFKHI